MPKSSFFSSCTVYKTVKEQRADCAVGVKLGHAGFTLIELLVAVVIGSIIVASVYAVFFSVVGAGSDAQQRLERTVAVGRFLDNFAKDVEGAYYSSKREYTGLYGTFTGTSSVMLVSTYTYPARSGTGPLSDLIRVRYHVEQSEDGNGLSIFKEIRSPYFTGPGLFDIEVVGFIDSLKISYLKNSRWTGVWDSIKYNGLPEAVRVEVGLVDGDKFTGLYRVRIR